METGYQNEDPSTPPPRKKKEAKSRSPPRRFSLDALNTPVSITKSTSHHHHHHQHHQSSSSVSKRHSYRHSNRDSSSISSTNSSSNLSIYLLSPGFTPQKSMKSPNHKRNSQDMVTSSLFPTTPATSTPLVTSSQPAHSPIPKSPRKSTIGSGRSSSIPVFPTFELIEPEDNVSIPTEIDISDTPQTPTGNIITEQEVSDWYGNSKGVGEGYEPHSLVLQADDKDDDDSEEEERDVIRQYLGITKRHDLENPFVEVGPSPSPIRKAHPPLSISNPFTNPPSSAIDYSTHIELVKSNGEKFVKELSPNSRSIKAKRLNFSSFNTLSPPPSAPTSSSLFSSPFNTVRRNHINQDISSKYINKNLNGLFIKPKNIPDFEIYKDDNDK